MGSNTSTGALVLKHPNFEEINAKLLNGDSVETVAEWLRTKYRTNKRKWISKMTLQAYRRNHLNLKGDVLADIKRERDKAVMQEKIARQQEIVKSSQSYQAAKRRLANDIIDTKNELLRINQSVWEQIAVLKEAGDPKKIHLVSAAITDLLSEARQLIMDYNKLLDNQDKHKEANVNINIGTVKEHQNYLKEAILETFKEVAPELLPIFIERLREKVHQTEGAPMQSIEGTVGPVRIQIQQNGHESD